MHDDRQPRATSAGLKGREKRKGSAKNRTSVRCLDLSFEGNPPAQNTQNGVINNGFRPHGGHRGKLDSARNPSSGLKKHPPSIYSFNKSSEQLDIEDDLDDQGSRPNSPSWAFEASRESNQSGEYPLFAKKYLSPNKNTQLSDPGNYPQSFYQSHKRKPRPSSAVQYYRPNRTHQYLSATDLKDCTTNEVDTGLGRPTRTTLLRARQRTSSAPGNAYQARRELLNKLEQRADTRQSVTPSYSLHDVLNSTIPSGESVHSYLTGARYNRAHCLDAKSLVELGVYMPRNNPLGCFVLKKPPASESDLLKTPANSTTSVTGADEESKPYTPPTKASYPQKSTTHVNSTHSHQNPALSRLSSAHSQEPPPQRPSSPGESPRRRAWDDQTQVEVDIVPETKASTSNSAQLNFQKETNEGESVSKVQASRPVTRPSVFKAEGETKAAPADFKIKEAGGSAIENKASADESNGKTQKSTEVFTKRENVTILEQIMKIDDSLNIKGTGMVSSSPHRPRSARQMVSHGLTYSIRPQSACLLPSVVIQGKAIVKTSTPAKILQQNPQQPSVIQENAESAETAEKSESAAVEGKVNVSQETSDETLITGDELEEVSENISHEEMQKTGATEQQKDILIEGQPLPDTEYTTEVKSPADLEPEGHENEMSSSVINKKVRFVEGDQIPSEDGVVFFMTEDEENGRGSTKSQEMINVAVSMSEEGDGSPLADEKKKCD